MSIELERRKLVNNQTDISALPEASRKRALELSAYFTSPEMDAGHISLALYAAMNFAHKNKQMSSALSFANSLIERGTNPKMKESVSHLSFTIDIRRVLTYVQAKKIKAVCERTNANDALDIEFDQFAEFEVCGASHTPIYSGSPSAACPFDGVKYQAKYKGTVCKICEVCEIGAPASGVRLLG
jgi:coatomer protein complex subunit alpha (xenin)